MRNLLALAFYISTQTWIDYRPLRHLSMAWSSRNRNKRLFRGEPNLLFRMKIHDMDHAFLIDMKEPGGIIRPSPILRWLWLG